MRLAVLADIHGNLPALEAVIDDMAGRHIDATVDLGDCVSGPLWPRETWTLLCRKGWPTVRGNHDRYVGCDPIETLGVWDRRAADELGPEGRAWLAALPTTIPLGDDVLAIHARPYADDAYLVEDQWGERLVRADPARIRSRLAGVTARLVLTGHSHLPGCVTLPDGPTILNPGSVGCPAYADDSTDPPHIAEAGGPMARYAIVETTPQGPMVELLSIPYPHAEAAARAERNGQPAWAHALRTGFARRSWTIA